MDDYQPVSKAAEITGVSRTSIRKWIADRRLKSKRGPLVGNLQTTLVSVKEVKELAKSRRPGRPRKQEA